MEAMALDERALRSLAGLLDDDDPNSLALVRREILAAGKAVIPYLEELRAAAAPRLAVRLDSAVDEVRFQDLKRDFTRLSADRAPDLEEGALLVSRFGHPGLDPKAYREWLDRVARAISDEIPSDAGIGESVRRLTNHVFHALGFAGNEQRYYDPDNSYLTRVIDTRRGIPVTLSVLLLLLAKRLRLPLQGIGAPGHFLTGFKDGGELLFVDAFRQGQLMTLPEVRRMLVRNGYEWRPELAKPAGARDILARMLRNLISIHQKTGAADRAERLSTLVEIVLTGREPEANK